MMLSLSRKFCRQGVRSFPENGKNSRNEKITWPGEQVKLLSSKWLRFSPGLASILTPNKANG